MCDLKIKNLSASFNVAFTSDDQSAINIFLKIGNHSWIIDKSMSLLFFIENFKE